jgi:hypothetical protein
LTAGYAIRPQVDLVEAGGRAPGPVFGRLGEAAGPGTRTLHARRLDCLWLQVGHHLPVGQRRRDGCVLPQALEQQATGAGAAAAAVEAKAELLEVGLR